MRRLELTGQRFGLLTVVALATRLGGQGWRRAMDCYAFERSPTT